MQKAMRYSKAFLPTLRELPTEAEVVSHGLLLRAGFIRKLASGVYSYLPLCLKVLRKIETIVREEMCRAGAEELLLPVVMPAELWKETGRWDYYGKELLRFKDRHERDFCIGPTHEEAITDLVRKEIRSWRELPKNLFQIQTKFRDEVRPRFGLMRGREFIMKDGYSFDVDEDSAKKTYQKMFEAYETIFRRCGLKFRAVEAGTGAIGGSLSHEFQVLASSGEDALLACDVCAYAANAELTAVRSLKPEVQNTKKGKYKKIDTPHLKTAEEVMTLWKKPITQFTKTLIFETNQGPIAAMVRADRTLSETKLARLGCFEWCHLASDNVVQEVTKAPPGFAGPIGLAIPVYADVEIATMSDFLVGANQKDKHFIEVNGGDFTVKTFGDLRLAQEGEACPRCEKGKLVAFRGIEVGQVFYLGTKYSDSMQALYLDKDGKQRSLVMGCFGIGISRTLAASVEQNHDDKGIIWPLPIAPFQVVILSLNQDKEVLEVAEKMYSELSEVGVEVLYDDRDERAGVKFADAELIGIPFQLVVGKKGVKERKVEFKSRWDGALQTFPLVSYLKEVQKHLNVA